MYTKSAYHPKLLCIYEQPYVLSIFDRQYDDHKYFRYKKTVPVELNQARRDPIRLKLSCLYFLYKVEFIA